MKKWELRRLSDNKIVHTLYQELQPTESMTQAFGEPRDFQWEQSLLTQVQIDGINLQKRQDFYPTPEQYVFASLEREKGNMQPMQELLGVVNGINEALPVEAPPPVTPPSDIPAVPIPPISNGSITIGTVTTGEPGSPASVMNKNGVLNFSIPQGIQGQVGQQGETGTQGIPGPTVATPGSVVRAFDTNFTPHATKPVICMYTIEIACTANLAGGQTGQIELRSDANSTPVTARCAVANTNSVSLALAVTAINTQRAILWYLVPPAHNVRLVKTGNAVMALTHQTEVILG